MTSTSLEQGRGARRSGVFVTGTDTGVGKTVAAACLVAAWGADYWKPIQTGLAEDVADSATVARLAASRCGTVHPSAVRLQAPLSPHAAAALEGLAIDVARLALPASLRPLVVEGAGGLMVPLDERHFMIDLIGRFALPAVLVARSGLGTINHTLLSLAALRARALPIAGVILVGLPDPGNRAAIEGFGKISVIAELPPAAPLDAAAVQGFAAQIPPLESVTP